MDKIFVENLLVRGIIGVNDWEREKPQDILINLTLYLDTRTVGASDNIGDTVSYKTVAKKVQKHAETAARLTVEALAADLARLCLEEAAVERVVVRVEKPGAVRFAKTVGVEIERRREE